MRPWIFALLCALWTASAAGVEAQSIPRVTDVRIGVEDGLTRLVVDSDKPLNYNIFLLDAGSRRVVVDFPRVRWSIQGLTAESGAGLGDGAVAGYRYAHNTASTSRLVLDMAAAAIVASDSQFRPDGKSGPYRTVIDLEPASADRFAQQARAGQEDHRATTRVVVRKPLIVIDPGHGGKDPGASASGGLYEKQITLGVALALRDELLQTGRYDVALTRATDVFIELDERVTRARNLGADLFISLHADAGPKPETRGASVYTLSSEGEKRAEATRQKNDWVLAIETDTNRSREVNQILADLVQRDTKNQSARFAQMLVPALSDAGWPALQNTHRKKGFYVLLSPDVPAVLLEMGFLTNAEDEAMLVSEGRRRKLVKGVAEAIDAFFAESPSLVARR